MTVRLPSSWGARGPGQGWKEAIFWWSLPVLACCSLVLGICLAIKGTVFGDKEKRLVFLPFPPTSW